ncbi:hypothetical protein GJ744_010197 [Endocarpon pusillum]|uniref:Uncharacterized protein n=1 Tax=Endocarpon pusillum TaxID=364733 RepID=A0A8H7AGG5_9EURO|nr:hypothetical protein GJ744_010197 [Endocarpon pusillum]
MFPVTWRWKYHPIPFSPFTLSAIYKAKERVKRDHASVTTIGRFQRIADLTISLLRLSDTIHTVHITYARINTYCPRNRLIRNKLNIHPGDIRP